MIIVFVSYNIWKKHRCINSALSTTFLALIPKKEKSKSFLDFRSIPLCNTLYKIISKIIAERLKVVLNSFITKEQHAFLIDRLILDAVAMTQECHFSISSKNIDAAALKIDLKKAFDCVDWGFLRILLAKIGLRAQGINWIMACVENVNFSIIINGIPSSFFQAERDLRQGCPLSPLLFILVMNSLSSQINRAVAEGRCRPIKICKDISLSHNLFVDDILILAMLYKSTWVCLYVIFQKFQSATGLIINKEKSLLYHNGTNLALAQWIAALFGINHALIKDGFTYLGFHLKAKGYRIRDWQWLIDRFYNKISCWEIWFLSLASRFILVQAVLSQLAIYWAHLFLLPASITKKMNSLAANFLWGVSSYQSKIHWVKMDSITRPKKLGGWGLLHMKSFGKALLCKTLLRGIYGKSPWSIIINQKYLKGRSMVYWYRRKSLGNRTGSSIWQSFRKIQSFFMENLRWRLSTGSSILIGLDPTLYKLESMIPPALLSTSFQGASSHGISL